MPNRRSKIVAAVACLVLLQVAIVAGYRWIEGQRGQPVRFAFERLTPVIAPALALEDAAAAGSALRDHRGRVVLVHFWATWCPPCVEELPALLAAARAFDHQGLTLLAVSVDDDWPELEAFFEGEVPPEVYRAVAPDAHRVFGVHTLPDTYLVDRDGQLRLRYGGARPWDSAAAREHLADVLREGYVP